jgi:hypothetical protein
MNKSTAPFSLNIPTTNVTLPLGVEVKVTVSQNLKTKKEEANRFTMEIEVLESSGTQIRFWRETNAASPKFKKAFRIQSDLTKSIKNEKETFSQMILFDDVKGKKRTVKTASGVKFFIIKEGVVKTGNIVIVVDDETPKMKVETTKTCTASIKDGKIYFGKVLESKYTFQCNDWRDFFEINTKTLPAWKPEFDVEVKPDLSVLKEKQVLITLMSWARGMAWGFIADGSFCRIYLFGEQHRDLIEVGKIYKFWGQDIPEEKVTDCKYDLLSIEPVKATA